MAIIYQDINAPIVDLITGTCYLKETPQARLLSTLKILTFCVLDRMSAKWEDKQSYKHINLEAWIVKDWKLKEDCIGLISFQGTGTMRLYSISGLQYFLLRSRWKKQDSDFCRVIKNYETKGDFSNVSMSPSIKVVYESLQIFSPKLIPASHFYKKSRLPRCDTTIEEFKGGGKYWQG